MAQGASILHTCPCVGGCSDLWEVLQEVIEVKELPLVLHPQPAWKEDVGPKVLVG